MTNTECREITLRDGRTLAYAEYGSPKGLPIIHCHGTPSSRVEGDLTFSDTLAAELGVRIIVPDRPGMGRSDFQPNRRIVDWRWIIGPDRRADGTEAKQGRKDRAGHRRPHSFDGGASKSKNRRRGRLVASVGDQEVPASVYRHSTGL